MLRLGILSSGFLGFETLKKMKLKNEIIFVFTDSNSKAIIDFCVAESIPLFKGNPRNKKATEFINRFEVDVICSVNYLFLIEDNIILKPKKMIFNLHGSLLPKYRGRTPHVWAIINNEKKAGITAHIIEKGCDTGAIIEQVEVPILEEDTGADILQKYTEFYYPLIAKVLDQIENNSVNLKIQNEKEATYFGKRTPKDGRIDWNWNALRIYNWVRAQANPYPGAFCFYKNQKIIIDKVTYQENLNNEEKQKENGTIISLNNKVKIKVNNGYVLLEKVRDNLTNFEIGKKLD